MNKKQVEEVIRRLARPNLNEDELKEYLEYAFGDDNVGTLDFSEMDIFADFSDFICK